MHGQVQEYLSIQACVHLSDLLLHPPHPVAVHLSHECEPI